MPCRLALVAAWGALLAAAQRPEPAPRGSVVPQIGECDYGADCEAGADDAPSSVALLQRALWYRRGAPKAGWSANVSAPESLAPASPWHEGGEAGSGRWTAREGADAGRSRPLALATVRGRIAACVHGRRSSGGLPLTIAARSDLESLRALGLLSAAHSCPQRVALLGSGGAAALAPVQLDDVKKRNTKARYAILAWAGVAIFLIVWSVAAVAWVPQKRGGGAYEAPSPRPVPCTQGGKALIIDEKAAWDRSFFSWLSLSWADRLVGRYGKCLYSTISEEEVVDHRADHNLMPHRTVRRYWSEQVEQKGVEHASLAWALQKAVGWRGCLCLAVAVVVELSLAMIGMVVALDYLLSYLEEMEATRREQPDEPLDLLRPTVMVIVLLYGVPMTYRAASITVSLVDGHYSNMCKAGLACMVYEKVMNLPVGSTGEAVGADGAAAASRLSVSQLLNVDIIECWSYLLKIMVYSCVAPLVALVLLAMLVHQLHLAGLLGLLYLLPGLSITVLFQYLNQQHWKRYQCHLDKRLRFITETVTHIRAIKSLAWERSSVQRISSAREAELLSIRKGAMTAACNQASLHALPWMTMLIAMYLSTRFHGGIPAHKIIVVQRILMSLLSALQMMTQGLRKCVQVPNSFRRIKDFLNQPDRPRGIVVQPASGGPDAPAVRIRGTFTFVEGKEPALHDLDIAIPRGELVAIVGEVASGKSALLQALIGELYPVGEARVEAPEPGSGRIAYCSQVPWIFEGTLRENVILGQALDHERYYRALHASALTPDLQILPGGDQVTIGSYGIRLSGGQRARVALARAAYMQHAEVVVMDDPFASVDVPTGQHICTELLRGPALRGCTRVVAMQPNPSRLHLFDRVVCISGGRVTAVGPPAEVVASPAFLQLLACASDALAGTAAHSAVHSARAAQGGVEATAAVLQNKADEEATALRDAEVNEYVTWATLGIWLKAAGYLNLAMFFGMIIIQRIAFLYESLQLARWINAKMLGPVDDVARIRTVLAVVVAACVSMVLTVYAGNRVGVSASRIIHARVITAILRAPVDKFFDKQPIGRLINRLSFDMRQVDDAIAFIMMNLLNFCAGVVVVQSFILSSVPGLVVLCAIPFYMVVGFFVYLYRGVAMPLVFHSKFALSQMQDLQAVVTTSGVSIRANGMVGEFMLRYRHSSACVISCGYLIYHVAKSWVQSRVFLCFSTLTCMFALGGLWSNMPMGTLAAIITLSFNQMTDFDAISMIFSNFLNVLNALQRLAKHFDIPQEAAAERPGDPRVRLRVQLRPHELCGAALSGEARPTVCSRDGAPVLQATADGLALELVGARRLSDLAPGSEAVAKIQESYRVVAINNVARDARLMAEELCKSSVVWLDLWQSRYAEGMRVQIEGLTAGYGGDKNVLHNVSIDIPAGMKVGFAGTTGCGKSTILLCMLRLLEPRAGRVMVGDLDASKVGLNTLRSLLGLVPQDPTIFEGSWRYNVDPFDEYPDGRVWEALRCVRLMPFVRTLPGGVDAPITKDGASMSFGQRQLLSLARMVIRQPPVLLLDECTSALDPATQEAAQDALLHNFPMSTIIAIAHRVETILKFDRIVALKSGTVAEHDTVDEVLKIPNGVFAGMVNAHRL